VRVVSASRAYRAYSGAKQIAESQTDSSRQHAARACKNGHVKKTGTLLANASIFLLAVNCDSVYMFVCL
jgi:hypothetical protein